MIATVRVAPVERWCEYQRVGVDDEVLARAGGTMVRIDTATMSTHPVCGGKQWNHAPEDVNRVRQEVGMNLTDDTARILCEHMLEMD